ncbi:2-dehydropantoate 2-reductase [Salipaludibacillus sp. HK11]|uniref:2-dehydropantoate 2-reductase n=1 Tax=Salipaludibacillus sp. HK11 TaxID=3394320 RepID=UPI0039FD388C
MNIVIVGGGAIGLLTANYLLKSDHNVQLITRTSEQAEFISTNGILCENEDGIISNNVVATCYDSFECNKEDLIIVTVKQTQLSVFLSWAKQTINREVPLLFLQNGMGHIDRARAIFDNCLFSGVTTHGAIRISLNEVKHTGVGKILIGGDGEQRFVLSTLMSRDGNFPIHWSENIDMVMRKKLLVNVVVNPLTAIHEVKNGMLLTDRKLKVEAYDIFDEARNTLGFPKETWEEVVDVIRLTADNHSSMLVDRMANRKTEVDAITGYMLELASNIGRSCKKIQEIHKELKKLERKDENE